MVFFRNDPHTPNAFSEGWRGVGEVYHSDTPPPQERVFSVNPHLEGDLRGCQNNPTPSDHPDPVAGFPLRRRGNL